MKAASERDPLIHQLVAGRYQVIRLIGKGGMGAVYEVRHTRLGRTFAIKTLAQDLIGDAAAMTRLRREADIISRLNHPHIVQVVDWEELEGGSPCLVMEYLRGESVRSHLNRSGPMTWAAIARVGDEILSALTVAHRAGVVHRDIKPDNIFLAQDDEGVVRSKLVDFGVSKSFDARTYATANQGVFGTPAYMSPEQAEGDTTGVDAATDVWAMGALLFEMATGEPAFQAQSVPSILYKICHGQPLGLEGRRDDAPEAFRWLVHAALSRDPGIRVRSASMLRMHLRAALSGLPDVEFTDTVEIERPSGDFGDEVTFSELAPTAAPVTPRVYSTPARLATPVHGVAAVQMAATMPAPVTGGEASPSRARVRVLAAVTAIAVLAVAVLASIKLAGGGAEAPVAATAAATPSPTPSPSRSPSPTPSPSASPSPTPASSRTVKIEVTSTPPGAQVYRVSDGARIGQTPYQADLERGGVAELLLKLSGHEPMPLSIPLDADATRQVELVAVASAPATHRRPVAKRHTSSAPTSSTAAAAPPATTTTTTTKPPAATQEPAAKKNLGNRTVNPFGT